MEVTNFCDYNPFSHPLPWMNMSMMWALFSYMELDFMITFMTTSWIVA